MLIGIAGIARSGKNTVAEMIMFILTTPKRKHTYQHYCRKSNRWRNSLYTKDKIIAFANSLKQIAAIVAGTDIYAFIGDDAIKYRQAPNYIRCDNDTISHRKLYQILGDMFRTQFGDYIWVNILKSKYAANISKASDLNAKDHLIISDLRYIAESGFIKNRGGVIIKIESPTPTHDTHSSEQLIGIIPDKVIFNNKTGFEQLFNNVKKTVYELI